MRQKKKSWHAMTVITVFAYGLMGSGPAAAGNTGPPGVYEARSEYAAGQVCSFPILFTANGKLNEVVVKGGRRYIGMAPGVVNTITNLDTPEMVFTRKVGGSIHVTTAIDGSGIEYTKGQIYFINGPTGSPPGIWLIIGDTFQPFDALGNYTQPMESRGRMIDICALLTAPE